MTIPVDTRGRLLAMPDAGPLLEAVGARRAFLVGGAVRDLLRDDQGADLDLAVEGDAGALARAIQLRFGGELREHARFGTATVETDRLTFDVAATRRERYRRPGALPEVEPAAIDEDLGRRDFTINAMAIALAPERLGELLDPYDGRGDLERGLVRTLHAQSFEDDPTRLLRAVRYAARFGFALERETEAAARRAIEDGAIGTVSGVRVGDQLRLLLAEHDAPDAVEAMGRLGLDRALDPLLEARGDLVAATKLGALETGADPVLAALGSLASTAPGPLGEWATSLGLEAAERRAVQRAAAEGPRVAAKLRDERELRPSELHDLVSAEPPEVLAVALAYGARSSAILDYVSRLRGTTLEISGADLIAAGLDASPRIGWVLDRTLARKLDGEISGRDEELRAALEVAAEGGP